MMILSRARQACVVLWSSIERCNDGFCCSCNPTAPPTLITAELLTTEVKDPKLSPRAYQYLEERPTWLPEQGYILFVSRERFEALKDGRRFDDFCSQSVPEIPDGLKRRPMLCLYGAKKGEITHVARSEVRYSSESGRDRLDMWNHKKFPHPIRVSAIRKELAGTQAWRAHKALGGGHCSPSAFKAVMEALEKADPAVFKVTDGVIDRRRPARDPTPSRAKTNWAYQRDAVVTALEIAGLPKGLFSAPAQLPNGAAKTLKSVFDSDADMISVEDLLVFRDYDKADKDWQFVKDQPYPAKTFANGDTQLTIVLANKLELERQLGTDLIYVNETLNAVVFVQYKMFLGLEGEGGYRPDSQLDKEIARMDAAANALAEIEADESCEGYRFGPDPFFLKFCRKLLTHEDKGHVPGIYVPLSYWKRLVKTPEARGLKGGLVVYPETFGRRHFTPTAFIDMIGRGWAGTTVLQSKVIIPYLKEVMRGRKGVVLAVQSSRARSAVDDGDPDLIQPTFRPAKPRHPGRKRKVIQL